MTASQTTRTSSQLLLLLWLLLGSLFLLNLVYKIYLVNTYAPELGGFERNVIWGIQQIMSGKPLYTNIQSAPFAIIQYMPLYYHLVAFITSVFQINPANAHAVYTCARGLNLLFCLLSSGLLLGMARRVFKIDWLIAFGVSVLAFLWMGPGIISGRPDSLKALLFMLTILALVSFPKMRKRYAYLFAVLSGCAAFFCKQDGLVFCGILPLALLFQGNRRDFFIWSLLSGLLVISLVLLLIGLNGPPFLANVLGGLENGISISWFVGSFGAYFGFYALLFALGIVLTWEFSKSKSWSLNVLSSAMCCAFIPQLFFSLKYGSAPNYFLEATLISLLMLAIWIDKSPFSGIFQHKQSHYLLAICTAVLLFYIPAIQWITAIFLNQEPQLKAQYENQKEVAEFVHSQLKSENEWVLVDIKRQWEDHLSTLLYDRIAAPQRDVIMQVATAKGKIDLQPLKNAIKEGTVRYAVTELGTSPDFLNIDPAIFKPLKVIGNYQVWKR